MAIVAACSDQTGRSSVPEGRSVESGGVYLPTRQPDGLEAASLTAGPGMFPASLTISRVGDAVVAGYLGELLEADRVERDPRLTAAGAWATVAPEGVDTTVLPLPEPATRLALEVDADRALVLASADLDLGDLADVAAGTTLHAGRVVLPGEVLTTLVEGSTYEAVTGEWVSAEGVVDATFLTLPAESVEALLLLRPRSLDRAVWEAMEPVPSVPNAVLGPPTKVEGIEVSTLSAHSRIAVRRGTPSLVVVGFGLRAPMTLADARLADLALASTLVDPSEVPDRVGKGRGGG